MSALAVVCSSNLVTSWNAFGLAKNEPAFTLGNWFWSMTIASRLPNTRCAMTTHHIAEEPDEGKLSRPVLKTSTGSDARA